MSTRSILIKDKIVAIVNELTIPNIVAYKVYTADSNKNSLVKSTQTRVYPIEERTKYMYQFEDGLKTHATGTTSYLLGGMTNLSVGTLALNDDVAFKRYSELIDKLESKLIDYQDFQIINGASVYNCSLSLVDSESNAISNQNEIVFNIKLKVDWKTERI